MIEANVKQIPLDNHSNSSTIDFNFKIEVARLMAQITKGNLPTQSAETDSEFSASEVCEQLEIPRTQQLAYIVQHHANDEFIKPVFRRRGAKTFLYIKGNDMPLLRLVWKYVEAGMRYRAAFNLAIKDLKETQPTTLPKKESEET